MTASTRPAVPLVGTDLRGHVAVVTGASRGIGRGIALRLGRLGATVVVNYARDAAGAAATVAAIEAAGSAALAVQADVAQRSDVVDLFQTVLERCVPELLVITPLTGTMRLQHDGDLQMDARTPGVMPRGVEFELQMSAEFSELVVPLSMAQVAEQAATVSGDEAADVRFTGVEAVDPVRRARPARPGFSAEQPAGAGRDRRPAGGARPADLPEHRDDRPQSTRCRVGELEPGAPGGIVRGRARRPATHRHDRRHGGRGGAAGAAAGLPPAPGTTPLAYLRDLRLVRAHEQLDATDPAATTTVREVAAGWGFGDLHRFTVAYQKRCGHHPKVTLAADPT
jgi:hypothetical protein